jgi:hypothetical protein
VPVKTEIQMNDKPILSSMTKASDRKPSKGPGKTFISPEEMKKKKLE